jgi:hypothetical protein
MKVVIDVLGWLGAAIYLLAYALVSTKKLAGDACLFQGLNILGGTLLVINSAYFRAWPSVGLNLIWVAIAAVIISGKITRRKRT